MCMAITIWNTGELRLFVNLGKESFEAISNLLNSW